MKYVILRANDGRCVPVIFPDFIVHADMALALDKIFVHGSQVEAAGFVTLGGDTTVHGESETCELKAQDIDAAKLAFGEVAGHAPDAVLASLWAQYKLR